MAFLVKMIHKERECSYFRKLGYYGFDFVTDKAKDVATRFTNRAEAEQIIAGKDYYCKMFGADDLIIVTEVKPKKRVA